MNTILRSLLFTSFFLMAFFLFPVTSYAATFKSGENVTINDPLDDLYVVGQSVTITSPIQNDLLAAGQRVTIHAPVSNEVFVAGRTISLNAPIGNTLRAAGETITLSAPVRRDVILLGSMLTLEQAASVSGDLIATGETILIQSPVSGDIHVNGKHVTINNTVSGSVTGQVGELILGSNASVSGNLDYTSQNRAVLRDGAQIGGQEQFHRIDTEKKHPERFAGMFTQFALYKLVADILLSLALVFLCFRLTDRVTTRGMTNTVKLGFLGLAVLVLGPILAVMLLVLLLPGIMTGLLYGVLVLLALFLSKVFVGRLILKWFYTRQEKQYALDWKAAVVGPIAMFVLLLIPVLGWFVGFVLYLITLGSLTKEILSLFSSPKETPSSPASKKPRRK